jgi:hypothetical protein
VLKEARLSLVFVGAHQHFTADRAILVRLKQTLIPCYPDPHQGMIRAQACRFLALKALVCIRIGLKISADRSQIELSFLQGPTPTLHCWSCYPCPFEANLDPLLPGPSSRYDMSPGLSFPCFEGLGVHTNRAQDMS